MDRNAFNFLITKLKFDQGWFTKIPRDFIYLAITREDSMPTKVRALFAAKFGTNNYESLEFYGDRVLSLIVITIEYHIYGLSAKPGKLTELHDALTSNKSLTEFAVSEKICEGILTATACKNYIPSSVHNVCCDSIESLFGAVYLYALIFENIGDVIHELYIWFISFPHIIQKIANVTKRSPELTKQLLEIDLASSNNTSLPPSVRSARQRSFDNIKNTTIDMDKPYLWKSCDGTIELPPINSIETVEGYINRLEKYGWIVRFTATNGIVTVFHPKSKNIFEAEGKTKIDAMTYLLQKYNVTVKKTTVDSTPPPKPMENRIILKEKTPPNLEIISGNTIYDEEKKLARQLYESQKNTLPMHREDINETIDAYESRLTSMGYKFSYSSPTLYVAPPKGSTQKYTYIVNAPSKSEAIKELISEYAQPYVPIEVKRKPVDVARTQQLELEKENIKSPTPKKIEEYISPKPIGNIQKLPPTMIGGEKPNDYIDRLKTLGYAITWLISDNGDNILTITFPPPNDKMNVVSSGKTKDRAIQKLLMANT